MSKHGTASIGLGLWAEFVSVVARNLPRDLDPEQVKGWVESTGQPDLRERLQRAFAAGTATAPLTSRLIKVLTVTCHGNATASQFRQRGEYSSSSDLITDERFPIPPHAPVTYELELFQFDHNPSWEEVIAERARRNLDEPIPEQGFFLGIQHPDEQREHPIVITHAPVRDGFGSARVLVLYGRADHRELGLSCCGSRWTRGYVFVGVRKVA